uniref:nucleotide-binding protein n=2 Tax=Aliarcobacter TaxID=2321111 RepID=UPI00396B1FC9
MKKENKSNIHIVVQTKGGAGKTTFSSILSTLLYLENKENKIQVFELDDNNSTRI